MEYYSNLGCTGIICKRKKISNEKQQKMSNCSTTECIAIKGSVSQEFLEEKVERCWDTNFMLKLRGIARPLSVS